MTVYKLRSGISKLTHKTEYLIVIKKSVATVLIKNVPSQHIFWISKVALDCDYKKIRQIKL